MLSRLFAKMRRKRVWVPLALALALLAYSVSANWFSLAEGVPYLVDGLSYEPRAAHPVTQDGPLRHLYDLARTSSHGRMEVIKRALAADGIAFRTLQTEGGFENIFVPCQPPGPFVLIDAHYDKDMEEADFQAATDNAGSVAVLLAVIHDMKDELKASRVAFLFTPLEERGCLGAIYFTQFVQCENLDVSCAVCVDCVGRGAPVLMTPADRAGFRFHIPFYGSRLYDGRSFGAAPARHPVDVGTLPEPLRKLPVQRAFLSYTDANAFLAAQVPACHIMGANMWHADQTWGKYSDTADRLDETDLQKATDILEDLVRHQGNAEH
jgi:hypothetical protein